jgi:hypothetical protein
MKKKTVLFLDIDGVLHPAGAVSQNFDGTLSMINAFRWERILRDCLADFPEVALILHSTWRLLWETDQELKQQLPAFLGGRFNGTTPRSVMSRYASIQQYCEDHGIERYVIVDDERAAFPASLSELILCASNTGLSGDGIEERLWSALKNLR